MQRGEDGYGRSANPHLLSPEVEQQVTSGKWKDDLTARRGLVRDQRVGAHAAHEDEDDKDEAGVYQPPAETRV